MATQSEEAKARAEAKFNREQQRSRDAEALKAEMAAQARAVDKKTARLKALRLAKEAEDRQSAPPAPTPKAPARRRKP
jgi:hypothetical protein